MIKVGDGKKFKDIKEVCELFNWDPSKDVNGRPNSKINATFLIEGNYYAWFPKNAKNWTDAFNDSKTEIKVNNENWSIEMCEKRRKKDKLRKFVTFAENGQKGLEFVGVFKLVSGEGKIFIYEIDSTEFDPN